MVCDVVADTSENRKRNVISHAGMTSEQNLVEHVGPLAVFSSCVMLAELLVSQIVRTSSDHFDVIRRRLS